MGKNGIKQSNGLRVLLYFLVVIIGLLAAFFIVFGFLFTDYSSALDYQVIRPALTFLIYLVLGFVFSFIQPAKPWLPALLLGGPAILVLLFFSIMEFQILLLVYGVASFGAALLGAYLSAGVQKRFQKYI